MYEAEINSLTNQIRAKGITGNDLEQATEFIKTLISVERTGEGRPQLDTAIEKARGTKWFPMIGVPAKDNYFWSFYRQIADYNPAVYWEKVSVPVLIIQAERDIYVPVASSVANIDRALRKAGNKDYTILILPRALHTFNINPEPGQPFEWWHVAPGFPDLLTAWVNQRMKE